MAFYATFVGINRYADTKISELACAVNDALALHALFVDSISDIEACYLLNERATCAAVQKALEENFKRAGSNDIALFYFAGHGDEDHQQEDIYNLFVHDTQIDVAGKVVLGTSIPMDDLARCLSVTQAKAAIIILDCCHSGGVTDQIWANATRRSVSSQNLHGIATLQGQGRLIICASKKDEYARERSGHGVVTSVLLDIFKKNPQGVYVGFLTDMLVQTIGAEANRFGWKQTPVIFNHTEGGLRFPPLQPGKQYAAAFPDTSSLQVTEDINSLFAFGYKNELIQSWASRIGRKLLELQQVAINKHRILDGRSLLVIAPTSSGKTFIGELAAAKALMERRKAVFLLPFKALANEKFDEFNALYGELGYRIVRCTGDYGDSKDEIMRGQYDIALLTYEMFLGLLLSAPSLLTKIGLVVIDEVQFIADATRGINLELLLTNILVARERGIEPQIIALSAVIGDVNSFDDWLGCRLLYWKKRPLPLIEGVLDRNGTFQYINVDGQECQEQILQPYEIVQRKAKPSSQDVIVPLTKKLVQEQEEQIVIFRNKRGSAIGCASYLSDVLGLPPATDVIAQLPDQDTSSASRQLREALQGGTAFHTSDLKKEEKAVIEPVFRTLDSPIHVLAATTTVSTGINTPANTVVIVEHVFEGDEQRDFTVAEYKNMAGRAGRLGLTQQGRSILLAATPHEREKLFQHYVKGQPEPITSAFSPNDVDTWVLRLLGQVPSVAKNDLTRLLANTYGGYLSSRKNPDWRLHMEIRLAQIIDEMSRLELTEEEDEQIRLSLLGHVCCRSALPFESLKKFIAILKTVQQVTAEQLMAYLQILPETGWISIHKTKDTVWQQLVSANYGNDVIRCFQRGLRDQTEYYSRCKRAAILSAWIQGTPVDAIEQRFHINGYQGYVRPGDIINWANMTRLYLQSSYEIADILLLGQGPDGEAVDQLLQRLEFGFPLGALDLLKLPVPLSRGEYLALYNAGYTNHEQVLALPNETLAQYIKTNNSKFPLKEVALVEGYVP